MFTKSEVAEHRGQNLQFRKVVGFWDGGFRVSKAGRLAIEGTRILRLSPGVPAAFTLNVKL